MNNNILRKYIKTTKFEMCKIPYLIHRFPKGNVSRPIVDNTDVIFLRKNIQPRYILILPLLSYWGGAGFIVMLGFPGSSADKESAYSAGDPCLIPGLGRPPGEENIYSLQYSGLENSMDCKELDTTEQLSLSPFTLLC